MREWRWAASVTLDPWTPTDDGIATLELAAYLGHPKARMLATGNALQHLPLAVDDALWARELKDWVYGLKRWGLSAYASAALASLKVVCDHRDRNARLSRELNEARSWAEVARVANQWAMVVAEKPVDELISSALEDLSLAATANDLEFGSRAAARTVELASIALALLTCREGSPERKPTTTNVVAAMRLGVAEGVLPNGFCGAPW